MPQRPRLRRGARPGGAQRWPLATLAVTAGLGHRRIVRDEAVRAMIVEALS